MVSVIMLTYNRESWIEKMISDILGQSFSDFEFIIVNNGSTDGTGVLLSKFAGADSRIRVITLDRAQTIGKGRNVGLRHAAGEFVAYVDDDDRVSEDFLGFLMDLQKECNADIAMCGADEKLNGRWGPQCMFEEKYILSGREAVTELLKRERIRAGTPAKLFRKTLLEKFPFDEEARSEDIHTMYKYFAEADKVILHGLPKYHFIRHGRNNSIFTSDFSKLTPEMLEEYLEVYRERADYLTEKYPEDKEFFEYTVWSFMISMCGKIEKNEVASCAGPLRKMKDCLRREQAALFESQYVTLEEKMELQRMG